MTSTDDRPREPDGREGPARRRPRGWRPWAVGGPLAAAVLVLAGCGADGEPAAAPTPTVTVTETVTASPGPGPCQQLGIGENVPLRVLFVTSPRSGEAVTSPFTVEGCTNAFEATYSWELVDGEGQVLAEDHGTASCGTGCLGSLSFEVTAGVEQEQVVTLRVFTISARDGSVQDLTAIPVRLRP